MTCVFLVLPISAFTARLFIRYTDYFDLNPSRFINLGQAEYDFRLAFNPKGWELLEVSNY